MRADGWKREQSRPSKTRRDHGRRNKCDKTRVQDARPRREAATGRVRTRERDSSFKSRGNGTLGKGKKILDLCNIRSNAPLFVKSKHAFAHFRLIFYCFRRRSRLHFVRWALQRCFVYTKSFCFLPLSLLERFSVVILPYRPFYLLSVMSVLPRRFCCLKLCVQLVVFGDPAVWNQRRKNIRVSSLSMALRRGHRCESRRVLSDCL